MQSTFQAMVERSVTVTQANLSKGPPESIHGLVHQDKVAHKSR